MASAARPCAACNTPLPSAAAFCPACGAPTPTEVDLPAVDTAPIVDRLCSALAGRYAITREIGAGGMAIVYLAQDLRHHRPVAVKVLRAELAAALGPERFLREIEIAAQLQHPHILPLYDSGVADGFLFYVMPFIEGQSLRARLAHDVELPIVEAVRILSDVADALAHAHHHGLVHRDIKPDNVLISGRHALVADFGVAKAVSQATSESLTTTAGVSMGTPAYMAPEQAVADPHIDHRADVYAFGVLAYEILTGRPPFTAGTAQAVLSEHLTKDPMPITDLRPSVPRQLAGIVMRCLQKRPADRWQGMEELLPQLESLATSGEAVTPDATGPPTIPRRGLPRWAWAAAAMAVVTVGLAAAFMLGLMGGPQVTSEPVRRQLTYEGKAGVAALSPDGQYLAYQVLGPPGKLMVKDLTGRASLVVEDSVEELFELRWSPDGTRLGVAGLSAGGADLRIFPRLGGTPERAPHFAPFFAWSPDGARMATWYQNVEGMGIQVVDLRSGEAYLLRVPDTDKFAGAGDWSSRGSLLALVTNSTSASSHLWVLDLEHRSHVLTLADSLELSTPTWAPDGQTIYYLRGEDLYQIAVDPRSGRTKGVARRLLCLAGASSA